jgi:hypothetical protein
VARRVARSVRVTKLADVDGVLDSGVHALSADRAVDVCGVTGQQQPSLPVKVGRHCDARGTEIPRESG